MKDRILQTLRDLRQYALGKGFDVTLLYHEEDSYLMRFANSGISLNTNEHLIRLEITAYQGRKRAVYELITDLGKLDEMKRGIDTAAEMVVHAQPLSYDPTVPAFPSDFVDDSHFDPALAAISNEERLQVFNALSAGLETDQVKLSGIFSNGMNIIAQVNTRSEHTQFFQTSDAQVTAVLSHAALKWEVTAEQSAQRKSDLDPGALHNELAFLVRRYQTDPAQQVPLGKYNIVFGLAATADLLNFMGYIAYNGGLWKRGFCFMSDEKLGHKVLSDKFTLVDDPDRRETFPFKRDFCGLPRKAFPVFDKGIFKSFIWSQDDADEFSQKATGHSVSHRSMVLGGGGMQGLETLEDLVKLPRQTDLLYIPFLHYMNIVNPSKGVITGSSRFGALLLKKDGSVAVPYNVRITQSLLDIFGDNVAWLSTATAPYNTSMSYGARNPTAIIAPRFMQVNDLEISHSNASY